MPSRPPFSILNTGVIAQGNNLPSLRGPGGKCISLLRKPQQRYMIQEMYLGSWAGPSLDRRRNSQELPNLCTHSSKVVTGFFPEKKDVAEGVVGWDSAVFSDSFSVE